MGIMGRVAWVIGLLALLGHGGESGVERTADRGPTPGRVRARAEQGRGEGEAVVGRVRGGRVGILGVPPAGEPARNEVDPIVIDEEAKADDVGEVGVSVEGGCARDSQSLGGVLMPGGMKKSTLRSLLRSVVRIHVTRATPDFGFPWRVQAEERGTGSGFPIAGRKILTNAHVVADFRIVEVERPGKASRFSGRVVGVAHDPDLAIVTVDDPEFWEGLPTLSLADGPLQTTIPQILSEVLVIGYPTGGDTLSVTKGVVNRAEVGTYAHSAASLLHVQIDAAINPGNSGGPAVTMDGEVIGVAFQGLRSADSIGYIIPAALARQVLTDFDLHGQYTGIAQFGITVQELRNETLKRFLGLPAVDASSDASGGEEAIYQNGCLVVAVDGRPVDNVSQGNAQVMSVKVPEADSPEGEARRAGDGPALRRRDVILRVGGEPVAQDCTVKFREAERLSMSSLLIGLYQGDHREVTVLRDGKVLTVDAKLKVPQFVVPTHTEGATPRYIIFGGLVIVPLTATYILDFKVGKNRINLSTIAKKNQSVFQTAECQEIVVLSRILSSSITRGYEFQNNVIETINGVRVRNLKHASELLFDSDQDKLDIGFGEHGQFLVIDKKEAIRENRHILSENKILSPTSVAL